MNGPKLRDLLKFADEFTDLPNGMSSAPTGFRRRRRKSCCRSRCDRAGKPNRGPFRAHLDRFEAGHKLKTMAYIATIKLCCLLQTLRLTLRIFPMLISLSARSAPPRRSEVTWMRSRPCHHRRFESGWFGSRTRALRIFLAPRCGDTLGRGR